MGMQRKWVHLEIKKDIETNAPAAVAPTRHGRLGITRTTLASPAHLCRFTRVTPAAMEIKRWFFDKLGFSSVATFSTANIKHLEKSPSKSAK
jgi:hypothetical protein